VTRKQLAFYAGLGMIVGPISGLMLYKLWQMPWGESAIIGGIVVYGLVAGCLCIWGDPHDA
jgi:hypothetical protein